MPPDGAVIDGWADEAERRKTLERAVREGGGDGEERWSLTLHWKQMHSLAGSGIQSTNVSIVFSFFSFSLSFILFIFVYFCLFESPG